MPKITGAQFIADTLQGYGVTHVFFVPYILGHTMVELEERTGIKRILTHGEKAAAYMADGYARACGRPGICMAQMIGAANLAAGLRDASLACSPVIALTGGPYPASCGKHVYQEIDDLPVFRQVTKFSAQVSRADRLPDVVRQAFRAATTGTPGPVYIQLQGHLGEIELDSLESESGAENRFSCVPPFRPEADGNSVREVARLLQSAKKPLIVAGGGVRTSRAHRELVALAERLSIPVATSLNAKEVIPGNHPLAVGVPGLYCRESANRAALEADLVFFIGSRTGSQTTFDWRVPPMGTPVIQLDVNPAELGRHYPNRASLLGDAKVTLSQLIREVDPSTASIREEWVERVRGFVHQWQDEFGAKMNSDAVPVRPERICRELTRMLPDHTLLVSETGHSGMWTGGMVDLNGSGQQYIRAAGSLGWGLPASLGAKLALPEQPVLLFTGDGGFWYHIGELETAARWNIKTVFLVNNNSSLNQEMKPNRDAYGGELHGEHADLWKFRDVNFVQVAEAMGVQGVRVEKPGDLPQALDRAFSAGAPFVIDVATEVEAVAPLARV
jgi:acetolactate synthase-1/2/3 large subunit